MPFSITVSGETLEECLATLFVNVQTLVESSEQAAAPAAPAPAPAPAHQVAAADETASLPPAKKVDPEAMRTEVRALLTPLMKTDQAGAAKALVKSFGDGIGAVPEDKLPELLQKARALVGGAA